MSKLSLTKVSRIMSEQGLIAKEAKNHTDFIRTIVNIKNRKTF